MMNQLLTTLATTHALALRGIDHAYDRRWLQAQTLAWPVVSVGNLSVGGAGKTPVVIALVALLRAQGMHPDVLSRGYGRLSPALAERVNPDGDVRRFGDEPLLMARATDAPVYVSASRYAAGSLAEQQAPAQQHGVHLLDDGFQHRQLARTVNLVVMHPSDVAGSLLPAGRLREPLVALERADALLLRDDDRVTEPALTLAGIRKPIFRLHRELLLPPLPGPAFAFCGIAHPDEFFQQLRTHGASLTGTMAFRDHHPFRHHDVKAIAAAASGASAVLTTEKDLVRLGPVARSRIARAAPLLSAGLQVGFTDAPALAAWLTAALRVGAGR